MPIKVLVIDGSGPIRALLTEIIDGAPDLTVVGAVPDLAAGREAVERLNPDVITLAAEMAGMDGIDFLDRLMHFRPLSLVILSPLGTAARFPRPQTGSIDAPPGYAEDVRVKIRAASRARLNPPPPVAVPPAPTLVHSKGGFSARLLGERVIAIGASTGGTEAIRQVLCALPAEMPPIVMVQHMPETFTPSFAKRLNSLAQVTVIEAQGGEQLHPGMAYLAPGHSHLRVKKNGNHFVLELSRDEPVNRHRPAVDVMFWSMAEQVGSSGLGVILTGMGRDGAQGLLAMRQAGAWNIGQDQASCVVYGMPREAAEIGALDEIVRLGDIAGSVLARLRELDRRPGTG